MSLRLCAHVPHCGSDSPKDAGSTCAHNLPAFVLDRIRFPKGHGKHLRKESPVGLVGAVPGGRCRGPDQLLWT